MLKALSINKITLVTIGIFLAIFLILGLPFKNWGFLHDDWGVIYHAKTTGNKISTLFTEGSMTAVQQPNNYIIPEQSFFAVLYRPFVYLFLHIQMVLVGVNAYALMLITIFFHALNAVLLFFILLGFISFWESLFATLLFAFHLSMWDWMGWIAGQNQVVNLTLVLVITMLLKKYFATNSPLISFETPYRLLRTNAGLYLISATLLYAFSLFYREEALIMPFWLMLSIPFMVRDASLLTTNGNNKPFPARLKERSISKDMSVTISSFLIATAGYFFVRSYNFPLKSTGAGIKGHLSITSFLYSLKNRFFDVVTLLTDIANLAWLPGGNRLLKGSLLALFLSFILWLFYKNKKKLIILYCITSMFMWMWPAVWRYYSSRFLYMGLPFLVVALVLLVTQYRYKSPKAKNRWVNVAGIFCIALTITNTMLLFTHFKYREKQLHTTANAFKDLIQNPALIGKKVCFIGLPYDTFVSSVAQAMWLNGIPADTPIYYDNTTFLWGSNIQPADISIESTKDGFHLTSHNPDHAWFLITNSCLPMGTKSIEKEKMGKILELNYQIDKKYLTSEHVWITWDYEKQCFIVISKN